MEHPHGGQMMSVFIKPHHPAGGTIKDNGCSAGSTNTLQVLLNHLLRFVMHSCGKQRIAAADFTFAKDSEIHPGGIEYMDKRLGDALGPW